MSRRILRLFLGSVLLLLLSHAAHASIANLGQGRFQLSLPGCSLRVLTNDQGPHAPGTLESVRLAAGGGAASWSLVRSLAPIFGRGASRRGIEDVSSRMEGDSLLEVSGRGPAEDGLGSLVVRQIWRLDGDRVHVDYTWEALDTVAVRQDASILFDPFGCSGYRFLNTHQPLDTLGTAGVRCDLALQQGVVVKGDSLLVTALLANPFHGDFHMDEKRLQLMVMRTREANSDYPGPRIWSTLLPGDVVRRRLTLLLAPAGEDPFAEAGGVALPSPYRDGGEQAISLIGDNFPTTPRWTVMRDPGNSGDATHEALVEMLTRWPQLRYTVVITFDVFREHWRWVDTYGWEINRGHVAFVQLPAPEGEKALLMRVNTDTSAWLEQQIGLEAGEEPKVRFWSKLPEDLAAGGGLRFVLLDDQGSQVAATDPVRHWCGWMERWRDFHYVVPEDGEYTLRVELRRAGGIAFVDDIVVRCGNRQVPMANPGFEQGRTPIRYTGDQFTWWDAHGRERLAGNDIPLHYVPFLRRLDRNRMDYGYEDRIALGIHAYHHVNNGGWVARTSTVEEDSEFGIYDSSAHAAAFRAIRADADTIGLSDHGRMTFRAPRHHFQRCTLHEAVKSGIRYMDGGYARQNNTFYPFYLEGGDLWLHEHGFWGDDPDAGRAILGPTREMLRKGGWMQWGWHPGRFHHNEGNGYKEWLFGCFQAMMDEYPALVWELPHEAVQRLDQYESWPRLQTRWLEDEQRVLVHFQGSAREGTSLVLHHAGQAVLEGDGMLDGGTELQTRHAPGRSFVVLPELPAGEHTVELPMQYASSAPEPSAPRPAVQMKVWPSPFNGRARVRWSDPRLRGTVRLELFNLLGRRVLVREQGVRGGVLAATLDATSLASGLYLLRLTAPASGMSSHARLQLVR